MRHTGNIIIRLLVSLGALNAKCNVPVWVYLYRAWNEHELFGEQGEAGVVLAPTQGKASGEMVIQCQSHCTATSAAASAGRRPLVVLRGSHNTQHSQTMK